VPIDRRALTGIGGALALILTVRRVGESADPHGARLGRMVGATLGVAILGALFAAWTGGASDGPGVLDGIRMAFLVGGLAELVGVAVAVTCISRGALQAPQDGEVRHGACVGGFQLRQGAPGQR